MGLATKYICGCYDRGVINYRDSFIKSQVCKSVHVFEKFYCKCVYVHTEIWQQRDQFIKRNGTWIVWIHHQLMGLFIRQQLNRMMEGT
jgi:hypothetical protein